MNAKDELQVKVFTFAVLLFTFSTLQLLRLLSAITQIFSNLIIDRSEVFYYFVLYNNTFSYKHTLSLTTFDKLCEKQRPSGFSNRCIPIHYNYFCRLRSQSKIII